MARNLKVVPIGIKPEENWSPEKIISDFLSDVKSGKIKPDKIMITFFTKDEDGSLRPNYWYCNISIAERVALLEVAKLSALDEWKV